MISLGQETIFAIFCRDFHKKRKQDSLIWLRTKLKPWETSKHKSSFSLSFQSLETERPAIFNTNNAATVNDVFKRFIDQVKGEIEAWSQSGSGWVVKGFLAAFVNVARYEQFRGGSYVPLQEKLQNKKAVIYAQNIDN